MNGTEILGLSAGHGWVLRRSCSLDDLRDPRAAVAVRARQALLGGMKLRVAGETLNDKGLAQL